MIFAKPSNGWIFPKTCRRGHVMATEADTVRNGDKYPRCRVCHMDTVRKQRERALLAHKRPQAEQRTATVAPRSSNPGAPVTSVPADADFVRVWAEANGIPFRSWSDLPRVNAARRQAIPPRLEFEARP